MTRSPVSRHGSFVLLRRLRLPLILLICVYAGSVLVFTLIPGTTPSGQPWKMSFLHAFYFVSFLGTTIGLGEVPFPFSDAQRLWATASIYGTVIAWLYAIGALFAVLQDPMFRRISHEGRFERAVRRLREPFYLICGYDDSGYRIAREFTEDCTRVVVVDSNPLHVDAADIDYLSMQVPALEGDASDPRALTLAGLTHPQCAGLIALTGHDEINTYAALAARLLNPGLPVLCAARDHEWHPRMAAAGVDHIINPFDTFAERVAMSIRTPSLHVIYEALTTQSGTAAAAVVNVPRGRWILCGWSPFTRALRRQLLSLEITVCVIDKQLDASCDDSNSVRGDPTDPEVLRLARADESDALVAGTEIDLDNLAIVLAARHCNKDLFVIARQTERRNASIFRAVPADIVMLSSYVVAAEVLRHLRAPLLSAFLRRARYEDEAWAAELLAKLRELVRDDILESWTLRVEPTQMPIVCAALARGEVVNLRRLMTRVDGSAKTMRAVPLMLQRSQHRELLPSIDHKVQLGDQVLFCGRALARARMRAIEKTRALAPESANLASMPTR